MYGQASGLAIPVSAEDHIQGSGSAAITLVEYGDYQCPARGMAYPEIMRLQREFGKDLRFVFRNFPLTEVHPLGGLADLESAIAGRIERR